MFALIGGLPAAFLKVNGVCRYGVAIDRALDPFIVPHRDRDRSVFAGSICKVHVDKYWAKIITIFVPD